MEDKIEIELPFMGFYESIHDEKIDDQILDGVAYHFEETLFQDLDVEKAQAISDAMYGADIDWDELKNEYCEELVNKLASELEFDFTFSATTSPRFYNFETDRLFVKIPKEEALKVKKEVETYDDWAETIHNRFTSYDGFFSYFSNDATNEEWKKEDLAQCQWQVVFEAYFKHNGIDYNEVETDCAYEIEELDSVNNAIDKVIAKYNETVKETIK